MKTHVLSEVADVLRGVTFGKSETSMEPIKDFMPIIRAGNIQTSLELDSDLVWVPNSKIRDKQLIQKDDIIMCASSGSSSLVGKCAKSTENWNGSFGAFCTGIRANKDICNPTYLYYFLKSPSFTNWATKSSGANIKNIRISELCSFEISLPPLPEQKRIATILDKADAIRRKRQQAIQLADDFLCAVFLDMFGDPVTNPKGWDELILTDIADIRSGVTKGKKIDLSTAVTLPYMRVANVQDGYLDLADIQEITVSPHDAEKCRLMNGDILLTEGGDPDKLGRGYVWHSEVENCIHQNHIFSVRVHDQEKVSPLFLSAVIASQRGKRYFLKVGKQTTGIATINKTVLSEFVPIIPPYDVQIKYVAAVHKVQDLKKHHKTSNMNLFDSICQKAFAGDL